MKTKIVLLAVAFIFGGGLWLAISKNTALPGSEKSAVQPVAAVSSADKQIIEVNVKEGYQPREVTAKAGVPVLLKMKTQGTFDCTTAFSIPRLGVRKQLPSTGETIIEIPAQKAGDSIQGVCGMGMYSLVIKFT